MNAAEIASRSEKMGRKGLDMRTIILDLEDRLGRVMTAAEHQAFLTGWKASAGDRQERSRLQDLAAARAPRP